MWLRCFFVSCECNLEDEEIDLSSDVVDQDVTSQVGKI